MSLIDSSYFVGTLAVPNISGTHPAATINLSSLNRCILIYERQYLIKLLGSTLYDEFITDLEDDEEWAVNLSAELLDADNLLSPIAYYVWYFWMRDNATSITSGGAIEQKSENAMNVSPSQKMAEAYNQAVRMTVDVIEYLNEQTDLPSTPETDPDLLRFVNTFNI